MISTNIVRAHAMLLGAVLHAGISGCAVAEHNEPLLDEEAINEGFSFGDENNISGAPTLGMGGAVVVPPSSGDFTNDEPTSSGGTTGHSSGEQSSGGTTSGGTSTGGTVVVPTCDLSITYDSPAAEVLLTGTLVTPEWAESAAAGAVVMSNSGGSYSATITVPAGEYQYKFIADGNWEHDPGQPTVTIDFNTNNVIQCTP